MSPRRSDPTIGPVLVDLAARLLLEEGPQALTTRRLAAEAGCSTMVVYTHFGGMRGLVRSMVHEGFERLQRHFSRVEQTTDPVADMALLGRAYQHNARTNPHLYAVMFGGSTLANFSLSDKDRQQGRHTLASVVKCAERCIGAGRFTGEDPELVAHQMWSAIHGLTILDLGGYLIPPYDCERCLDAQLAGLMVGAGDTPEAARRSVSVSLERMRELACCDRPETG